jgi:hypothetical protein
MQTREVTQFLERRHMMSKSYRFVKLLIVSTTAGVLWHGSCLTDNFWAEKWSEIVNRSIFGIINAAIGQAGAI